VKQLLGLVLLLPLFAMSMSLSICPAAVNLYPKSTVAQRPGSTYGIRPLLLLSDKKPQRELKYKETLRQRLNVSSASFEFRAEVHHDETRVMGLSSSEDRMIVA